MSERLALITGAGKGIGRAIAKAFAEEGIRLALCGRNEAELRDLADTLRAAAGEAEGFFCDVTQPTSVEEAVARAQSNLGPISILVNNAGNAGSHKFIGHPDELWHALLDVNLNSVYYVTKAVVPAMAEAHWGRIINIASTMSKVGGRYLAAYTASKHGVLGLTRALAVELVGYNITVNAICPGYVDTPMTDRSVANIAARTGMADEKARAALEKLSPQNRLMTPEEVAAAVVFLASDAARGINGQGINVDGGMVMF